MKKQNKILFSALGVSLLFHTAALICLQRYSVWFSSLPALAEASSWLSFVDKKERDEILKSTFASHSEEKEETKALTHSPIRDSLRLLSPVHLPETHLPILFSTTLLSKLDPSPLEPISTFSLPTESFDLLEHLPKEFPLSSFTFSPPLQSFPTLASPEITWAPKTPTPQSPAASTFSEPVDLAGEKKSTRMPPAPSLPIPDLPKIPTLTELETASYSDSFDADLVFLPKEEGQGYLFALTLIPRPDLSLPRIKQHITFLIDRSNSIQQRRLSATKAAIHKSLEELYPDDTFNIISFDSKMEKMSPHDLPCEGKSFAKAEEFLEKIQLGSFFATSDLYRPLFLTVPSQVQSDEIYTAILFTDSEALAKKGAQKALLADWTRLNGGKVSLFAIGVNGDHQLSTLDAAAAFNKGKLASAPTHRGIKRKLLKLIKTLRHPVAKNLSSHPIALTPQSNIRLYPLASHTPHLYLDQPYVILGETDTLDDFVLFVQGKLKNKWLNIKKTVSFAQAKKGNKSLKAEWALQKSYHLYENYLLDDNLQHIVEAQLLLEPFDVQAAFR